MRRVVGWEGIVKQRNGAGAVAIVRRLTACRKRGAASIPGDVDCAIIRKDIGDIVCNSEIRKRGILVAKRQGIVHRLACSAARAQP